LHFYDSESYQNKTITEALVEQTNWYKAKSKPYIISCDPELMNQFSSNKTVKGFTATNVGFYGPQGRVLRLALQDDTLNDKLAAFNFEGKTITNLEMETAGIYGLSKLLGHRALSMNFHRHGNEINNFK